MTKKIAILPGDGIGPEVVEAAIPVLEAAAVRAGVGLPLGDRSQHVGIGVDIDRGEFR